MTISLCRVYENKHIIILIPYYLNKYGGTVNDNNYIQIMKHSDFDH